MNKFSLAGDTFMPKMHVRQSGFKYSFYGPFTKNKERIKNSKEHEIKGIFIKTNLTELAFYRTKAMEI